MLQNILKPVLLLLFGLFVPTFVQAMHIIGGEMTYKYISSPSPNVNLYEFTLKIYRDCNGGGADFDQDAFISVYRGNTSSAVGIFSFFTPLQSRTNILPNSLECIQNPPRPCVQEGIYVFRRELPVLANENYLIVYQRCCRNNTINNIVNPGDIGATYLVELTSASQALRNSSPTFDNFPPTVICNRFSIDYSAKATDPEGDQLIYSFCTPLDGGGPLLTGQALNSCLGALPTVFCPPPFRTVPFVVPLYTPLTPMAGNPVVSINPTTGFISGAPERLGQYVVGICVEEYRNGQLLTRVQREFQFNVGDCQPLVNAMLATSDTVVLENQVYRVKSCGSRSVFLENRSTIRANIESNIWSFDIGGAFLTTDTWDAQLTFPDTGTYNGFLILNPTKPCNDTLRVVVEIYPGIQADFTYDYDTCVAGPVVFTNLSSSEAVGGVTSNLWNFGSGTGTSQEVNPEFTYPIPGFHPVTLTVSDTNACVARRTQLIEYQPAPATLIVQPDRFLGCAPGEITFNNRSVPVDSTYQVEWNFGDGGTSSGVISPTYTYLTPGFYDVALTITSPIGCTVTDTFFNYIRVEPAPTANFSYTPPESEITIFNNTLQFTDLSLGAARWSWLFGDNGAFSTQQNPTHTFLDTGLTKITLVVTHERGCKDSIQRWIDVRPVTTWFMPNAFTPNYDSVNEGFRGTGITEGITGFQMTIWNRWGELVFETNDPLAAWNGRDRNAGREAPEGVYVYWVTFNNPRGEQQEYRGFATLIR